MLVQFAGQQHSDCRDIIIFAGCRTRTMLLGLFFAGQLHSDFRAVIISPVAGQDPDDHADDLTDELFFAGQLHFDCRDIIIFAGCRTRTMLVGLFSAGLLHYDCRAVIISPVVGQDPADHAGDLAGGAVLCQAAAF